MEHSYIWGTLTQLGFGELFIALVKGLIKDSISKLHVNGIFSEEISLEQGIWQGYPISPLLFSLATQPFMEYMHSLLESNNLQGIRILDSHVVSFRFFADNLGIFILALLVAFNEAQTAIQVYEIASGSKLNLHKSTIIPFNISHRTSWLQNTGYIISEPETMHKYLGEPWGANLHLNQLFTFCLDKIASKLSSWSSYYLPFAGCALLIKHVLQAISTYQMMFISIPQSTIVKLNLSLKDFLWGFQLEGKRKMPLIA